MPATYRTPATDPPPTPRAGRGGCFLGVVGIVLAGAAVVVAWRRPWPWLLALVVAWPLAWLIWRRAVRMILAGAKVDRRSEVAHLRAIAVPTGSAWRALLRDVGLEADLDGIAPHVRPAIRLAVEPAVRPYSYGSQANGDPWLPPEVGWPEHDGKPMRFLLQLDLAEAHRACAELSLPSEGTFYVFEAVDDFEYRVHVEPPGARVRIPARAAESERHPLRVSLEYYEDLPEREVLGRIAEAWDAGQQAGYDSMQTFLEGNGGPLHKLLGHPNPVQDLDSIEAGGRRLLLQLDTDDDTGWMWGDAGRIYLTVPSADLARGHLSHVVADAQCG